MDKTLLERSQRLYPDKAVYTIKEAAHILGRSPQTLYNNKAKYPLEDPITLSQLEGITKRRPRAKGKRRTQPQGYADLA